MMPTVTLSQSSKAAHQKLADSLAALRKKQVYVGIPSTTSAIRQQDILKMLSQATGKKRRARLTSAAKAMINNAQLMYVHTHGSYLRGIPARPVIEPAILADGNRQVITEELKLAAAAALAGKTDAVTRHLNRAGLLAQNIVRAWFVDSRNGWAPNTPATIRRKGSDKPLIDTGELRRSIIFVVSEE